MATSSQMTKPRGKAGKFLRDVRAEMRKVAWPSRKDTLTYTWVVIVTVAIVAVFIGLIDALFGEILKALGILVV